MWVWKVSRGLEVTVLTFTTEFMQKSSTLRARTVLVVPSLEEFVLVPREVSEESKQDVSFRSLISILGPASSSGWH